MAYNINQIKLLFEREDLDLIIGSTRENCLYFTGFSPVVKTLNPYHGQSYVLLHREDPCTVSVVHPIGEIDQILDADVPVRHIETYGKFYREYGGTADLTREELRLQEYSRIEYSRSSPSEALALLIRKLGRESPIRRIGYDEDGMLAQTLRDLQQALPDSVWVSTSSAIRHSRRYKTDAEVDMLMQSARINEAAIHEAIKGVISGTSEADISSRFNQALVRQGAYPVLTMIKAGRAAVGGQRRQDASILLEPGDMLWFDSDAVYQGFWSDIARVYAVEKVSPSILKRYQALRNGMLEAFSFIRPGLTGKQVFAHVMDTVHRSGFPEYRRHHVGHAIGLEPYELPILSPSDENIIEEGMVLSVETPYYEFGIGALHIEDPLFVGASGNRFLTAHPVPELQIL
ncbi:M24 family metallopeptidase [Xenorhabdus griffiniae]|uniref:M24 family metallopeptidase n=1 Tax=Xenorhabdus griffiniae TaxID=351672 RepID=UPI002359B917|nr:Xaa-Pro peptidase family protein [Xenorhabdus griffiniae]MDC9607148.1 Xaa-Pro peptidase family protein [Xenorhabdus griffiniae]